MVQVPSGWITSGLDWNNPRNNRYEDTVNELYYAVNERDFYAERFSKSSGVRRESWKQGNFFTIRIETQLDYILKTLSNWLTIDLQHSPNVGTVGAVANFIDEDSIPVGVDISNSYLWDDEEWRFYLGNQYLPPIDLLSNDVNMGVPHYDMSDGGNLELKIGRSLGFLRDYSSRSRVISPDDLKTIYVVLNTLTSSRAYQINSTNGIYKHFLLNQGIEDKYQFASGSFDLSPSIAYNNWATDMPRTLTNGQYIYNGYSQETDYRVGGAHRYRLNSYEHYFKVESFGGYQDEYGYWETEDFDYVMLYNKFTTKLRDTNPQLNLVDGINKMNPIIELSPSGDYGVKPFPYPNTDLQTFPPLDPSFDYSVWETIGKDMAYVDFNKQGFLKYYTETP